MPPASITQLKQQLAAAGQGDYLIVAATGEIVENVGIFSDRARCEAAFAVIHQCSDVLKPDEKLRRITITFDDDAYVATVANIGGKSYGVVVQRPPPSVPPPSEAGVTQATQAA